LATLLSAGRFDAEIVPITTERLARDRATGEETRESVTLDRDEW
jgi:acetyl-CoA C-acetyltransferase